MGLNGNFVVAKCLHWGLCNALQQAVLEIRSQEKRLASLSLCNIKYVRDWTVLLSTCLVADGTSVTLRSELLSRPSCCAFKVGAINSVQYYEGCRLICPLREAGIFIGGKENLIWNFDWMQMNSVWNGIGNFYAARSDILSSGAVSYLLTYLLTYGNGNQKRHSHSDRTPQEIDGRMNACGR